MIFVTIHMPTISVYPVWLVLIQTVETCHNKSTTVSFHCPSYCVCTLIDCHNCIHQPLRHTCLPYSSSSHFPSLSIKCFFKVYESTVKVHSFPHFHIAEPKMPQTQFIIGKFDLNLSKTKQMPHKEINNTTTAYRCFITWLYNFIAASFWPSFCNVYAICVLQHANIENQYNKPHHNCQYQKLNDVIQLQPSHKISVPLHVLCVVKDNHVDQWCYYI